MTKRSSSLIAIAAASELQLVDGEAPVRVKLLPIGRIDMRDGRGPFFVRDRDHAERIVAATRDWLGQADMMFDYDHQSIYAPKAGVGGQAIAAGWIKSETLSVEDDGIYGRPEWTPAAAERLKAREYRYLSPTFMAAKDGGDVVRLRNVALVNVGAIDLPAIAAGLTEEDDIMDLSAIAAALGLSADATVEQIAAAIGELKKSGKESGKESGTASIAVAAGLAETASVEEIAAAITDLKTNYVPKSVVEPMRDQLKTLNSERLGKKVDELIAAGVVIPAKRVETLDWFEKDEVAAGAFFKDMPAIVTPGADPAKRKGTEKATSLTADEIAACEMTGMSHEDFLKAKNEEIA